MAHDDTVQGGWVTLIEGRDGRLGQVLRTKPSSPEPIGWPQRPRYRGKLVRVKALKSESGPFLSVDAGQVVDLHAEEAEPRIRDGRVRLARADEKLTTFAVE